MISKEEAKKISDFETLKKVILPIDKEGYFEYLNLESIKILNVDLKNADEFVKLRNEEIRKDKVKTISTIKDKVEGKSKLLLDGRGRSISDLAKDIAEILQDKNILFYRPNSRQIVEVGKINLHNTEEELYTGFINIKDKRMITLLEEYVDVGYTRTTMYGETFEIRSLSPTKADIVLCSRILEQALPQIERIFPIPLPIMHKGKLTFPKKGFDQRFSSWRPYDSPDLEDPEMDLKEAKKMIEKIFCEFCFRSKQDKTNAIAGLLTPFLRGLFVDFNTRTPVFFYLGNRERVGKDYCAGITGIVYDGQALDDNPVSSGDRKENNNEELRKKITSALISGRKRMHFANNKGYINNAILEQISTSKVYSDRLLGKNDLINLPNEMDFSLSGNVGVSYTPDFANRCRFVNLFLDIEDANSRKFDNPLLHEWILKNRGKILSSFYSLVENWINKGKPEGSIPFTSFPNWASICGGIMEAAGYDSPCVIDEKSLELAGDSETSDMKQLFEICYESYPDQPIKKNQIVDLILKEEGLFSYLDFDTLKGKTNFGIKLRKFIGRILSDIKLQVVDSSVRAPRQEYIFKKDGGVGRVGMVGRVTPMCELISNNKYIIVEKGTNHTKGYQKYKVIADIDGFLDLDGKELGPFKKGEIIELSPEVAKILISENMLIGYMMEKEGR